jgi:hypothetical protein
MFKINGEIEFLVFCLFNNQNLVMKFVIYLKSQNLEKLVVKFLHNIFFNSNFNNSFKGTHVL